MKKTTQKAMKALEGNVFILPSGTPIVAICKQLSDLIGQRLVAK